MAGKLTEQEQNRLREIANRAIEGWYGLAGTPVAEDIAFLVGKIDRLAAEPEVVRCIQCLNSKPVPPEKSWHIDTGDYRVCACERGLHDITSGLSLVGLDWYCDDGERKEGT